MIKLKTLLEGGHSFSDVVGIEQNEVPATLKNVEKTVLKKLGLEGLGVDAELLGSAGKKKQGDLSGDLDIAVSIDQIASANNISLSEVPQWTEKKLKSLGYDIAPARGFTQVSIPFPISGRENEVVQVDLMFSTSLEWSKFAYHSPNFAKGESKYKGTYRNVLLGTVVGVLDKKVLKKIGDEDAEVEKYALRLDSGVFKTVKSFVGKSGSIVKTGKVLRQFDKMITNVPDDFVKFLFGDKYGASDVDTYEKVYDLIFNKDTKVKKYRSVIRDKFVKGLEQMKLPVPENM